MTPEDERAECARKCWQLGAVAGIILFLLLWLVLSFGFPVSAILGIVAFVAVGLILNQMWCSQAGQDAASAPEKAPQSTPEPASGEFTVKPTAPLPGEAGLAERKAEWTYEDADQVETPPATAAPNAPEAEPAPQSAESGLINASTHLPGQAELAARKGTWKYQGSGGTGGPARLAGARDGAADDLKLIKGVGPKLEKLLNSMGFFHFDQIAGWTGAEVAWVDDNLEGFKGRVSRDDWVAQAATLAAGGETEFSKRSKG